MPDAVVTGALEQLSAMAIALKSAGFDLLAAETNPADVPDGRIDCYVQLPPEPVPAGGDGASSVDAQGLVARFDAVARLAPRLAPEASVVLVAAATNRKAASTGLVRLLIEAVLADHDRDGVRTAVIHSGHLPEEIAAFARSAAGVR